VFTSEEEASDTDLYELIWFVRIRGAPAHDVRFMLDKYQSERDNAQASLATPRREIENPILRNTPVPPQEQRTIIQDPRSAYIPIENSTGTNARLETQPTLNIQASRIQSNDVRVNPNTGYIMSSSGSSFSQGTQSNVPTHLRGSNTSPDPNYIQSKKGHAVESYFRDSKFNGSPEQSIENLISDFQICAEQQYLSAPQMSLFFVNTLADPARQFFLTHCSPHMPFEQIATQMRRHYNSESKKLQLQSEMDSLDLTTFMHKHQLVDFGTGLTKLVDYINALAPQLPTGFGDDPHKTRYLRRAVMSLEWAQQPISQVTTARYTFVQFITALQESLQLQEEISRAQATGINYGQYVNNPRDIGTRRNNRFSHLRNRQGNHWNRSRSPWQSNNRERSRSLSRSGRFNQHDRKEDRRRNPTLPRRRFCWGCGSPDHILSDRKCTPTLDSIKTNILESFGDEEKGIDELAEQFLTLHSRTFESDREKKYEADKRPSTTSQVLFEEALFNANEEEAFESQIAARFNTNCFDVQLLIRPEKKKDMREYSPVNLMNNTIPNGTLGFCIDIGAPRSVIGRRQLAFILKSLGRRSLPQMSSNNTFRFGDVSVKSLGMV